MHGEKRYAYEYFDGNPEEKRPFQDIDIDGTIILNWILKSGTA
jgi:hypothetical protein